MLKISRIAGLLTLSGIIGLYIILVFFNPYAAEGMTLPIMAMMLLAFLGVIATLKASPHIMFAISLALFVPIGFYMAGTPGIFKWIGILNLLFAAASLLMWKAQPIKESK
ncbi:MAG: hypothetical protein HZB18_15695 [Chloroflexi bacterium]|nr:hypothetical protein [Chloroflexota bacterium]